MRPVNMDAHGPPGERSLPAVLLALRHLGGQARPTTVKGRYIHSPYHKCQADAACFWVVHVLCPAQVSCFISLCSVSKSTSPPFQFAPHHPNTHNQHSHRTMLPPPPSTIVLARGLATHTRRQAATALKRPLPSSSASSSTSSPLLCRQRRPHPHQNQQQQQQQRSLATETTQATPVPPPPPSGRNRVYPAVLLVTLASVVYVVMT